MLGELELSQTVLSGVIAASIVIIVLLVACLLIYRRKSQAVLLVLTNRLLANHQANAKSTVLFHQQERELKELRQRLEALADSSHREVLLFSEMTSILGNLQASEDSLRAAFGRMMEILSVDFGVLELAEHRTMAIKVFENCDESLIDSLEQIGSRGWVVEERSVPFNALSFEEFQKSRRFRVMEASQSLLCFPCRAKGIQVGYFMVGFHRPHTYTSVELDGLNFCAEQFAVTYRMCTEFFDTQELSQLRHDYIANVSHELRTPLTTIYGYLNILKSYPAHLFQETEKQEMFAIMTDECQRLIRLINNLLLSVKVEQPDFSGSLNPVSLSLAQVVSQTCRFMGRELKAKGVQMKVDVPEDLAPIEGNLDLLYQVFQNLIANSIKFSSDEPEISILARDEGHHIVVELSDNGVGIEPQAIPKVFQKFYRAESQASNRPGLGIGLYLVQKLVQLHHGEITVTSELRQGTTFTLKFPKLKAVQNISQRAAR